MTLRTKFILYLIAIHLPPAVLAGFLFQKQRLWLIVVEILLVLSLVVGTRLIRSLFEPLDLLHAGKEMLEEEEFTTRFKHVGHADVDRLFDVYNAMLERLRVERVKSEEQQSLLEKLVRLTPAGIVMLDFDGTIAEINPAAQRLLEGARPAAAPFVGQTLETLGESLSQHIADLSVGDSQLVAVDGRRRLRFWRGEFMDRGFGRAFFLIEELTEELRASERAAYEKVIRMLSHEINNSVAAVGSLLESLLHYTESLPAGDRDDYSGAIEVSRARLQNLDAFTRDFASVVRIPEPRKSDVDLRQLVSDVLRLLAPELSARSIAAELSASEPVVAHVDQNQIEQVIINILRNAMESIGSNGSIVLSLTSTDERIVLNVRDSGAGISDDARANLFTPFYSSKRNGRGLGLTLVQEILSNHEAEFSLGNARDGGAEFRIGFAR